MNYKFLNVDIKGVNDEKHIIRGVFSTADEDRHGEVVDQKSWQLDDYLKNPVILFAHDHNQPAIGKAISLFFNDDGNLEGEIQFAAKEYEFANTLWKLYKGGFMRAFSVGFQPEVTELDEDDQVTLKKNTLFEISTVNVPANALALAKSKGIDTSPLERHLGTTTTSSGTTATNFTYVPSYNLEITNSLSQPIQKEGRVLSAKNRTAIENARNVLDEVLKIDEGKQLSNDTAVTPLKVETPLSKGVQNPVHIFNKAIRTLVREKRNLTN